MQIFGLVILGILVLIFTVPRALRALGKVIGGMVDWARDIRIVTSRPDRVDEIVGDSTTLYLRLMHKRRWHATYDMVAGTLTITTTGTGYSLDPAVTAPMAATGTLPETEAVLGVSPGGGVVTVAGIATTGETHTAADVPVTVSEAFLDAFKKAAKGWHDPTLNGWANNLFGGVKCDAWAAWMIKWIRQHGRGRVCKLEEVTFPKNWFGSEHVCVRVTMCPNGPVYYLDPWRFGPDDAVMEQDKYEKSNKPMPDGVIDVPM